MGVKWTKQQQQVIDLRDRNILVSAAAGSGKTAVLVERIITMLTDEEHPVNVDELLIVTFTEAAAGEMKERIRGAIEKALENRKNRSSFCAYFSSSSSSNTSCRKSFSSPSSAVRKPGSISIT